jgi:hypothetical protein
MGSRMVITWATVIVFSVGLLAAGPTGASITLEDLVSSDGIAAPALSPSGREFAFTADGQIKLLPANGGWPVVLTTTGGGKSGLNWSNDGTHPRPRSTRCSASVPRNRIVPFEALGTWPRPVRRLLCQNVRSGCLWHFRRQTGNLQCSEAWVRRSDFKPATRGLSGCASS